MSEDPTRDSIAAKIEEMLDKIDRTNVAGVCTTCYALVLPVNQRAHLHWHARHESMTSPIAGLGL